ncbi:SDR family NAD(P)-dependent oxidoreductase [Streptomyces sp. NBC_00490]|uniref:SDR family NAD(P)-dependent oxidoreductase n=1 Tax=Streptomyces sp. NBC_00490 TaxID=2903657 RepID=UPI002E17DBA1
MTGHEVRAEEDGRRPTAVVTGAARGLGFHTVAALAARDYRVLCVVRDASAIARLRALGAHVYPTAGDVTDSALGEALATRVANGTLELLIHNAGIAHPPHPLCELPDEEVLSSFLTHCLGPLRLTRALLPALHRARGATVVHVSSRWGSFAVAEHEDAPGPRHYAYRIGKAAQNMMSLCLRQELAAHSVRVVAVHPGALSTAMGAVDALDSPARAADDLMRLVLTDSRTVLPPFSHREGDPHPW